MSTVLLTYYKGRTDIRLLIGWPNDYIMRTNGVLLWLRNSIGRYPEGQSKEGVNAGE
jgi:hypothetical protein